MCFWHYLFYLFHIICKCCSLTNCIRSPDAIIVGAGTEVTTGLGTATVAGADASCEVRGLTVSDSLLESSTNIQPKRRFFAIVYFLFWWFSSRGIDSSRIKLTTSMFSGSKTAEYVYIESWSTRITLYTKHPSGISRIGAALTVLTVVGERYWECSSTKVEIVVKGCSRSCLVSV